MCISPFIFQPNLLLVNHFPYEYRGFHSQCLDESGTSYRLAGDGRLKVLLDNLRILN
jgi:hypothetical protein